MRLVESVLALALKNVLYVLLAMFLNIILAALQSGNATAHKTNSLTQQLPRNVNPVLHNVLPALAQHQPVLHVLLDLYQIQLILLTVYVM